MNFQSMFNGPFPFTTDGVVIGVPSSQLRRGDADQDHLRGRRDRPRHVQPREHAPVVGGQRLRGELQPHLLQGRPRDARRVPVRRAQRADRGGRARHPGGRCGVRVQPDRHVRRCLRERRQISGPRAPSNPRPYTLFSGSTTYTRPGIAYIALRRILGPRNFAAALRHMQSTYRQGNITEPQFEAGFAAFLPSRTPACRAELNRFFTEWFDTVYPPGGGANRPQTTAPGLDGGGFQCGS